MDLTPPGIQLAGTGRRAMGSRHGRVGAAVTVAVLALGIAPPAGAARQVPAPWTNCTKLNKRYPHGVGRLGAHDKTSGDPVTNFKRSTLLYNTAMRFNR